MSLGSTDDYGYYAVEDKVHFHDLHATYAAGRVDTKCTLPNLDLAKDRLRELLRRIQHGLSPWLGTDN